MSSKDSALRNFIPFGLLVVAAYLGLAEFRKINYTHKKDQPTMYKDQMAKLGVSEDSYQAQTAVSREQDIEKVIKDINIDNWSNVRGPRPWETNDQYLQAKKKREEERNKTKTS